ncbi:MAG: serine/threonine-protein kinase [Phototrophicaceae bacterium]
MVNISNILEQHLTRYQIIDRLGSGGMATVYRAKDTNLNRFVAIKVMHEHLGHDETFKDRFEQEAHFIAGFTHPNIVQVYDFDTIEADDRKIYYMVMPMLGDDTLVDMLEMCREKNATLPHERIKEIITDLADALDYAHQRGMIHRDIKPANILFDERNRAVLTDFGIARLAENSGLTAEGTIIGTPAYMSPEQATGDEIDYRSDIYALGIILFELLTGRPPFDDESTVSILLKHVQTPPPSVSQYMDKINPELDNVLNKVLAKKPNDRYQSAKALKLALEAAINRESDTERFKPSVMSYIPEKSIAKQPATAVINDTLSNQDPVNMNSVTRTINTLVIRPAKQNPLGFAALIVGIIALLFIARLIQDRPANSNTILIEETVFEGVDSMAGVDSMVGDAAFFTGDFSDEDEDINAYWETTSSGSIERRIADGVYTINTRESGLAVTSLFDPIHFQYADVNILFEGRVLETSANDSSAVGIVFRYQDPDNYNVFAVDGLGRYSIWRRENGQWCELRNECNDGDATSNWQANEAINLIGELNTLNLNVYDNEIIGYVNGELVFMMEEATFSQGAIGIYMATTQFGAAQVEIDSYNVSLGMPPASDSMTDDS